MSTRRLEFIDPKTGKPAKWGVGQEALPPEMPVTYFGLRVGTLYLVGDPAVYQYRDIYPGTHMKIHWITHLRAHLLRYLDAKYAVLGVKHE